MSDKFRNKYRIASARLKDWDYGNNGAYFITICTKDRKHFFGEIVHNKETRQYPPIDDKDTCVSETRQCLVSTEAGKTCRKILVRDPNSFFIYKIGMFCCYA